MNRFAIPALIASSLFSASAFAGHWDDDRDHPRRHVPAKHVVVHHVHEKPVVVYQRPAPVVHEAPRVVYRERIVYRDRPVYYERADGPGYYETEPRYDERPAPYPGSGSTRLVGQAVGAIAGGALGSQVGKGNGRVAATAIGAVLGSIIGAGVADGRY